MQEIKITENPKNVNELSFEERARQLQIEKKEEEQKAHKSPFSRFYQINKNHSDDLMWLVKENPTAYRILLFIFDHMDKYNAVMCSNLAMSEALEVSTRTIIRAVKLLKDKGFLHIYKSGSSNVYVANPDLVWNSWGNNIKYCEFPANIILSATEQEQRNNKILDKQIKNVELRGDKAQ